MDVPRAETSELQDFSTARKIGPLVHPALGPTMRRLLQILFTTRSADGHLTRYARTP